ncbi:hypothetical protein [Mucilaginibacter gotjawali]|uniref:Uncharacterized protein n=2 Tax=Mucilaginibacter gotjawali TaxID=1550579 RepID=A0A0X8X4W3_9SPHI|nr:hypothetical protein [Mucilaginibacter gotjawali]MBB3056437.1 hypothetical protein [Mucilaginibacter gotjawali]BAU55143.1 hypothetical protein MgSA37_03324 [Mucilaginibacter gotjawali]
MPNLAFHTEVLNQVIAKRAAQNDPLAIKLNNPANAKLKEFAVLGAMGPDMLRYVPVSQKLVKFLTQSIPPATSGKLLTPAEITAATTKIQNDMSNLSNTDQALAFELYFNPIGAIYAVLFSGLVVPVWPILDKTTDFFNKLSVIVQNQDEIALALIIGQFSDIQKGAKSLTGLPSTLQLMEVVLGSILTLGPWMEMNQTFPAPTENIADRRFEFLRWHKTSEFVQALTANATTDNQKAYVFGWQCHMASSITTEPFINNITGGPYRTHWWRNRLVGNFVDSWTFGFFEQPVAPTMNGDTPTPAYFDPTTSTGWPALCDGGNLQDKFNVGNLAGPAPDDVPESVKAMAKGDLGTLPNSFPAEISKLFSKALNDTYPAATQPVLGVDAAFQTIPAFDDNTLANAYVGASAVYWFMTSGHGALVNSVLGPGTGMPEPSWITQGSTPSPAQAGLNVGAAICAAILAALAALFTLGGAFAAGLITLEAALSVPIIDWATVANELFWLRKTLIDEENLMQNILVMGGLAYPPPVMLGAQVNIMGNDVTLPATDLTPPLNPSVSAVPNVTGIPLCKSNQLTTEGISATFIPASYPRWLDTKSTVAPAADLNFAVFPLAIKTETKATDNPIPPNTYPQTFVNGFGLKNGGIVTAEPYPTSNLFFGDAVSNAVQLIADGPSKLPDYNLDGDRGYGWLAWDAVAGSNPFNVPVQDMQEV